MNLAFGAFLLAMLILLAMTATPPTPTPTIPPSTISLSGTITDLNNTAIQGVSITVFDEAGNITGTFVTDTTGAFRGPLTTATPGTYFIKLEKEGKSGTLYRGLGLGENVLELSLERGSAGKNDTIVLFSAGAS